MKKDHALFYLVALQVALSALPLLVKPESGPLYSLIEILWTGISSFKLVLNATFVLFLLLYILAIVRKYYVTAIIISVIHILLMMFVWVALIVSIDEIHNTATFTPVYPLMMCNAFVILGMTIYMKFRKNSDHKARSSVKLTL